MRNGNRAQLPPSEYGSNPDLRETHLLRTVETRWTTGDSVQRGALQWLGLRLITAGMTRDRRQGQERDAVAEQP